MQTPKLSIITVNYRGWVPLERCLNSLRSLLATDFLFEVIIVDNFSNDGKLDEFKARYAEFTFVESKGNYGFSNGNNLGAKHATGEYLLFLNSDTVVTMEPLLAMLNLAQQNTQYAIVSAQQKGLDGRDENPFDVFPSIWTINSIVKSVYGAISKKKLAASCKNNQIIFPDWVSGSLVLISRTVFDQLNGWDEDFWLYYEDVDLCKRAKDMGGIVALQCSPSIIHQHGGTTRRTLKLTAFYKAQVIISRHIYFRKHYSGIHNFILQSFLILNALILDNLIPALFGLVFYPFGSPRKYLFVYFNLLEYYFNAIKKHSWLVDTMNVKLPEKN